MLRLHFLNVENGDCIILEHENDVGEKSFAVVDSNRTPSRKSPARDKLIELGAEKLSFVCITHPDKDHFSGILDVLTHFRGLIDSFYTYPLGPVIADKTLLQKYMAQIASIANRGGDADLTSRYAELMQIFQEAWKAFFCRGEWYELAGEYSRMAVEGFKDVEFYSIMPPKRVKGSIVQSIMHEEPASIRTLDRNGISAAILIKYRGQSVILGGDATSENWRAHRRFLEKVPDISLMSQVVKLPHHGSKHDNERKMLDGFFSGMVKPLAIISANGSKHPSVEVFKDLNDLGCVRLCTNMFNGTDIAIKRLHLDPNIDRRLLHQLNVFATIRSEKAQACKGDIAVTISNNGAISYQTQFNPLCGCHAEELFGP